LANKTRIYAGRFVKLVGDLAPRSVTTDHARQFRDRLEGQDQLSRASAEKHMHALGRLLVVGLSEGLVSSNTFHGIKGEPCG
jgi:hypothetical protein